MKKSDWNVKNGKTKEFYSSLSKVKSINKKNLLRGYASKKNFKDKEIDNIRKGNNLHDCLLVGSLIKSTGGLLNRGPKKEKKTSKEIYMMTSFVPIFWREELCYTCGYINSDVERAFEIVELIKGLCEIDYLESTQALELIHEYSKLYGASNFLSYKLAYIRSARDLNANQLKIVDLIEDEFEHRDSAGFHYSALENIDSRISLFVAARRRISASMLKAKGDVRKAISTSNFIPTPVSLNDISGFLLRASESSFIDTVYAIVIILNLDEEFSEVKDELEKRLSNNILCSIKGLLDYTGKLNSKDIVTSHYSSFDEDGDPSLDLYRNAAAFLERKELALYRNRIDKVIGVRLLSEIKEPKFHQSKENSVKIEILLSEDGSVIDKETIVSLDPFYRTYLFLKLIENRSSLLSLSSKEISFIFENTLRLEILLSEEEMRSIYFTAPEDSKSLVTVLALALFRKKSVDPDVDFEFRTDFISHVKEFYSGSISDFINELLKHSPAIASYIVISLDEVTLQKMYGLVSKATEASLIRCDILKSVGQKMNQIEYIIEAESIITREKVSRLQKYFDSSRIYVDSISMKNWLDSNPTMSTEQYRSLYNRIEKFVATSSTSNQSDIDVIYIQLIDSSEYLIEQIAKDAFEQFCLNQEFGIQSYLGRRIRHNTLDGVTIDTVDAVIRKSEHRIVVTNQHMLKVVNSWLIDYKSIVDKLRREHLQFKSSNSLFNAVLDAEESVTNENIRVLKNTLRSTGRSELLNDLLIAFCWKQISPQLENAARFIRTNLLQEARDSIDKHFINCHGAGESQMVAELHAAVNEVFVKVSDWFQVPETGFISASVKDLCQIILIDLSRNNNIDFSGNAIDKKYTGISVHRLYDCLAVLLQNAHTHGKESTSIKVNVCAPKKALDSVLESVTINITSEVDEINYEKNKMRILKAINSEETGTDMVTEGYSGIKKIKFITKVSEGNHTMHFDFDDLTRLFNLSFSIHAELVTEESPTGATL